jgi:exodeoxyribonuclease V beta subunit
MSEPEHYINFNASTVPLQDSNLIEASAGTGKTYSIAILVLRLVLEKQLSIKEVLMVTFTKAAVAELEERIRLFIRSAHKYANGHDITDSNIKVLVQQAIAHSSAEKVNQQLSDAVLFLDETAVLTIHSFCQQALNEFAFETNQLFGAEMLPDFTPVAEEELNRFWRRHITTLHTEILQALWHEDLKANMLEVLQNHLSGKKYPGYQETKNYAISRPLQEAWRKDIAALREKVNQQEEDLCAHITDNAASLKVACEGNTYAKKGLLQHLAIPSDFIAAIREKRTAAYITKLFPDLLAKIDELEAAENELLLLVQAMRQHLFSYAIQEAGHGVQLFKERNNVLGYDDLIANLHRALVQRNNPRLAEALQRKYKAVFIDEFQDTDRQQFEIFDKAFGDQSILFYIGDPKQSIYAWRKADIFTYFKARDKVTHLYSMNNNYRSSAPLIDAMNVFFLPTPDFDTFYFAHEAKAISYIPVKSPEPNTKGLLFKNGAPDAAFSIFKLDNNKALHEAVAAQVAGLLQPDLYSIHKNEKQRAIVPSDIGILVRTGRQGKEIKWQLARLGIPAVTIDDAKVLESAEARSLLYLMEAINAPDRSSINRALLSAFTGFDIPQITHLDDAAVLELFTSYKDRWQKDGIYTALMDFIADFNVKQILLQQPAGNGERTITNLLQLIELVHQAENRKNLTPAELISWLNRGIDGMSAEGDEYTQRVESDEEAVKIVTIHKSKGLEYNIVLAPYLDFADNHKQDFVSFRDPQSGDYIGAERALMEEEQLEWQKQQAEQENRRLLYVAITRAVYKCFIFKNLYYKNSTLTTFLNALPTEGATGIVVEKEAPQAPATGYHKAAAPRFTPAAPVAFSLQEESWRKMSYSMLAAKPEHVSIPRVLPEPGGYDHFIFQTLRRGAKTGNFLHFLFENISFTEDKHWDKWITESIRRFVPGQQEAYFEFLKEMLQQVLHVNIGSSEYPFTLEAIKWNKRLAELEFDFPVPLFQPDKLHTLGDKEVSILVRSLHGLPGYELEGMMNGKIDLFFEHDGRYYILDWKSNYLGGSPDDYSPAALAKAMNDNNYHLQYLLYTLAVKKYLESRLGHFDYDTQFGGVIYVFVRGVRAGADNGIFRAKPPIEKIDALERLLSK